MSDPFSNAQATSEWKTNELILKDSADRQRAGVSVLDSNVADLDQFKTGGQAGGAANGAPFHLNTAGTHTEAHFQPMSVEVAAQPAPYKGPGGPAPMADDGKYALFKSDNHGKHPGDVVSGQSGGGLPHHFYDNSRLW